MLISLAHWIERHNVTRLEIASVFALLLVLIAWYLSPPEES